MTWKAYEAILTSHRATKSAALNHMAKIYLSYHSRESELAHALTDELRQLGHNVIVDFDTLAAGDDWRRTLMDGLKSADVFVSLLTQGAIESANVLSEVGAARAFAETDGRMLVIPVILDNIQIPMSIRDVMAIMSPQRDIAEIAHKIDRAYTIFAGRIAARQKTEEKVQQAIESNADTFIDDAIKNLTALEKRYRIMSIVWYILGFGVLGAGLVMTYTSVTNASTTLGDSWIHFAYIALKSLLVLALLAAAVKYGFGLGRSYATESLKAADRLHAIGFGKFYLRVFGARATWPEVKEAFQNWNIDRRTAFSDMTADDVDPKATEHAIKMLQSVLGKASKDT
jgi:hypothetical protein